MKLNVTEIKIDFDDPITFEEHVQIVIGWNVIVAMKRFIVTKTAHLTMCTKVMSQQSFLMVHTESTTNA